MVKEIDFDIVGGYQKEEFVEFDPQETVNMFVVNDVLGRKKKALYPTPGLSLDNGINFVQEADGVGRAIYNFDDGMFVVVKDKIFYVFNTLSGIDHTFIGQINTASGYVGIVDIGTQLVFVDGIDGWIFDSSTSSFSQITSLDFPTQPIDISVLANRVIVLEGETKRWYYSAAGDAAIWNALDFNSITSYPDTVSAVSTLNGRLYIMGQRSVESWYDAGAPIDPYRRDNPAIELGCAAVGSVASGFGILVWLSKTAQGVGSVVAITGGRPSPISTQSIDTEFEGYDDVSDASGYIYKNELGHVMYVLNFTASNTSWMYDFYTKMWSKLEYKAADRHLSQKHTYFAGKHYVIDYSAPKLYELSNSYHDDAGVKIRRARISSVLSAPNYNKITVNRITIDLKQGTGGDCGIEEDPVLFLATSFDGGVSYGNQTTAPIGKIGERLKTTSFHRLGQSKFFVFKLEHYNSVPFVVLGSSIDMDISREGE